MYRFTKNRTSTLAALIFWHRCFTLNLMELSSFGQRFQQESGIDRLMVDLGAAMAMPGEKYMLGGGNPGQVPEVEAYLQQQLAFIANDTKKFRQMVGNYAAPAGETHFRRALAALLSETYGWPLTEENVALVSGSQSGFFMLFNAFAGECEDSSKRHVLLPLTPEYIGYADQGITDDLFTSQRPTIELLDNNQFKYGIDFSALEVTDETAAICVSRPTNPTGNVLTDDEVSQLAALAETHDIPLLIDNAYGLPFPNIIFSEANPIWNENIILSMSLSKLGLPATRTGIIVAKPEVVQLISRMNAIMNLTVSSVGAVMATDMVESGQILKLSKECIQPFYKEKVDQAVEWISEEFEGLNYRIHKPEGALFLWLWFPELSITSQELYQRLTDRGVLVVSGHYFYPGLDEPWDHKDQCLRITYSQDPATVKEGIKRIATEVRSLDTL